MKQIRISAVIALLEAGKTREEIAEHYEITMADCKRLFSHPSLKGRRALKQPDFELIDDLESVTEVDEVLDTEEIQVESYEMADQEAIHEINLERAEEEDSLTGIQIPNVDDEEAPIEVEQDLPEPQEPERDGTMGLDQWEN